MAHRATLLVTALLLLFGSTARAEEPEPAAEGEQWSLTRCLDEARRSNPDVGSARAGVDGARAARKGVRGAFLPMLTLEAGLMRWDSEITADFSSAMGGLFNPAAFSAVPTPASDFDRQFDGRILQWFAALGSSMGESEPIVVREAWTGNVSLTLTQPLTPLYDVYHGHRAAELGVVAASRELETTETVVALGVAEAYMAALKVQRLAEVARSAVEQLEANAARVRTLREGGVAERNDELKVAVALANARQGVIQAEAGVELSRAALAVQIGLDPGDGVAPADISRGELPAFEHSLPEVERRVLERRSELRVLEARRGQASSGRAAAKGKLIPDVVLLGNYTHTEGAGSFGAEDTGFVGVAMTWNVWDWGQSYYGVEQAAARVRQVEETARKVKSLLLLEARKRFLDLRTAREALKVSDTTVEQALENYRIEKARFDSDARTATELLDAQAQLTRARLQRETAFYDYLIALAALRRAIGEPPEQWVKS
jgi:outer membrane protein